jgi:transcriptional regulator with XRE-family HTH domain
MKRTRVDKLLQLAFLEGRINTHGAYEKAVGRRKAEEKVPPALRDALIVRLEKALASRAEREIPLTVGAFLKGIRRHHSLRPEQIFSRLGVSQNIYRMLEHDRLSPLRLSVETWKKFLRLFNMPVETLEELIRRTHQLVLYRPSFRTTLARYSPKKKGTKSSDIEKAASELYTKAKLKIPQKEEERLNALLKSISGTGDLNSGGT